MTYAIPEMHLDMQAPQYDNVVPFPACSRPEIASGRMRHPSQQRTTMVPAAVVVDFVEALTDIFAELRPSEMSEPVRDIDGILARLDSSDEWLSAGVNTETTLVSTAAQFRQVAAAAALPFQGPIQLRLMPFA